jgi:tight adherence protein C
MQIIFALLVGVIVFCGYLLFDHAIIRKKQRESQRIRLAPDGSPMREDYDDAPIGLNDEPSTRARTMAAILRGLGVTVDDSIRTLEPRFAQAGITSPDAPIYYLFFQRIVSLGLLALALILLLNHAEGMDKLLLRFIGLLTVIVALFGPKLYLQNKIEHRKKALQRALPDTLDLLLICVESGLALDAALNRVCNELGRAYPEMTTELNRTRLELALLNDRVRALTNLGDRTDMVAFRSLVSSLIQSERFGTSLSDTIRVLSEDYRLQRLMDAEVKAARLPVLLTVPLIFLLMPAFMLIVLGPAIIGFMRGGSALGK